MSEIETLRAAAKEISASMHALQFSRTYHEAGIARYYSVMNHYFRNCNPNKSVADSKRSLFQFKLDQFIKKKHEVSNFKYHLLETVSFPPLKVRYALKLLRARARPERKRVLTIDLELINLRPYQDETGKALVDTYGSVRKARTKLGSLIRNTMIISWDTSEDDIFIQLLILAFKNSLISNSNEVIKCFQVYTRQLQVISSIKDLRLRQELASEAFAHIVRCYGFPVQEYSFKKYISSVLYGLKKNQRSPSIRVTSTRTWEKGGGRNRFYPNEDESDLLNIDDFQAFKKDNGRTTYGVDRAALDTGVSRDTIYRYIRQNKIRPILSQVGNRRYRTLDDNTINWIKNNVAAKKALVKWISRSREISVDSARKRILRLKRRGFSLEAIYKFEADI